MAFPAGVFFLNSVIHMCIIRVSILLVGWLRSEQLLLFVDVFVSAPRTPLEESVLGFQVDKLIDAIQGEAKIKITVYEHDQGQVRGSKIINHSFN